VEVLVFEVEGQRHGLPAPDVREIVRAVALMPLPGAAAFEGAINLRGRVVPVLDLRRRLGLPVRPIEPGDHLIIACPAGGARPGEPQGGDRLVALRVDRAVELLHVDAADLDEVADAEGGGRAAKLADGLVFIHDLGALLADRGAGGSPAGVAP
jgi:purine-binding chemotaxis protein CheW